jgi:hypothetical protein
MMSSRDVGATRKEDIIIDFKNDVQSEEETGKSWGAENRSRRRHQALYLFNFYLGSHYTEKCKRAAEKFERAKIMAASNKM